MDLLIRDKSPSTTPRRIREYDIKSPVLSPDKQSDINYQIIIETD